MSPQNAAGKQYHHGHLRTALIDAAETLLEEKGAATLSLREVARRTGVSQAAPYAHFHNRQALLAAVAARGFQKLCGALGQSEVTTRGTTPRMNSLACGYVHFAVGHPMLFRLMFGTELADVHDPELQESAQASYAFIQAAVAARLNENEPCGITETAGSLGAWSLVHGLAMLIVDGKVPWPSSARARNALINEVASVYTAGLANVDAPPTR
jgi:AcrR family transcriptional regulator